MALQPLFAGEIRLKKPSEIWRFIEDLTQVWLPGAAFVVMFVVFCIQVICRYFFDFQFRWSYELTVIAFMWSTVMGACYASRKKEHVSFDLIYKKFGRRGRAVMDMAGDCMVFAAFCLLAKPAVEYIRFMGIKSTASLGISFDIVYAPILVFIFFSALYLLVDMLRALRTLSGLGAGREEER